jgi:small-conductance mechanosensitive channel
MYLISWADVLNASFKDLSAGLIAHIPDLVVAVLVFIIGWIIAVFIGRLVAQIVASIRVDQALRSAGVERVLSRAGFSLNAGMFLGAIVKWFIIIGFLVASLDVLGLSQVTIFLREVVLGYFPQVIVAVFILLVAAVIAEVAQRLVSGAAKAANISTANFLGSITRYVIWIFAILVALDHLGIGADTFHMLLSGIVVALSLAFGLAFGLGGQAAAARILEKVGHQIKD